MKKILLFVALYSISYYLSAQESTVLPDKACINCTTPQSTSAVVDVQSTSKGMLIPRMTTGQRTGISSPAKGLLVFDNTTSSFWYYDGGAWVSLSGGGSGGNDNSYWTLKSNGLDIYNNNSRRVGIGTTAPNSLLNVVNNESPATASNGIISSFQKIDGSNDVSLSFFGYPNVSTVTNSYIKNTGMLYLGSGADNMQFAAASSNGTIRFHTGGWTGATTERMRITNDGNVGIGTTTPDIKLQIEGGTNTSDTGGGFLQLGASNSHNVSFDNNEIQARNNGAASILHIQPDGAGILSLAGTSGKVGIGTVSPDSKLHILGGTDVNAANGGYIINGALNSFNLGIDNNEIQARNNGIAAQLTMNLEGGTVLIGGPTEDKRFHFKSDGRMGIGIANPLYTLDVEGNSSISGQMGLGTTPSASHQLNIDAGTLGGGVNVRVFDTSSSPLATNDKTGINVYATGEGTLYGIYSAAQNRNTQKSTYGVYGEATGGSTGGNFGVYGYVAGGSTRYGVYGRSLGSCTGCYAGYFSGPVAYVGTRTDLSDKKFKEKINDLDGALSKIMNLRPRTYYFKKYKYFNFDTQLHYGFIAQELQKEIPELVIENIHPNFDENNEQVGQTEYLGVNYIDLIPILTKGIQEQQAQIIAQDEKIEQQQEQLEEKEQEINNLNNRLEALESLVQKIIEEKETDKGQVGILSKKASLQQNQPNPFHENTAIHYYVPEDVKKAQLQITTVNGKVLDVFSLQQGKSVITLNAKQLPAGNYLYTLIADGQVIESKRMVLTK